MDLSPETRDVGRSEPLPAGERTDRGAAFQRLADAHLDAAYKLARAILRDAVEAQDATHDAFVQAWLKWPTLRDLGSFQPWFDRILINTCRNRLTQSRRRQATDISGEVALAGGDPYAQSLDRELIGAAISSLPPDQRVVVALRYYRDLPADQIAALLDVPVGTVRSRLNRARRKVRTALGADPAFVSDAAEVA